MSIEASQSFGVRTDRVDDVYSIVLTGELDIATAPTLLELGAEADTTTLLDLSGLTFMDSTGLRAVLALDRNCREAGRELLVVPGPPAVQKVFSATRTEEHLNFFRPPPGLAE